MIVERAFLSFLLPALLVPGFAFQSSPKSEVGSQQGASPTGRSESKLLLGSKDIRDLGVPIHFTAAEGETVGIIRAEVSVSGGPFRFRRVIPPKNSRLKVSAKERKQKGREAGDRGGKTVIELTFSAGSHAIRNGLIGYLQFSSAVPKTPQTAASGSLAALPRITVEKLETDPPVPELVTPPSSEKPLGFPANPPINPAQSCFFFAH